MAAAKKAHNPRKALESEKVPRNPRHSKVARMAYSVKCPSLRIVMCTAAMVANDIDGSSQRRNGTVKREVCSAERTSDEPTKIMSVQAMIGIQLLTKRPGFMFKGKWPY